MLPGAQIPVFTTLAGLLNTFIICSIYLVVAKFKILSASLQVRFLIMDGSFLSSNGQPSSGLEARIFFLLVPLPFGDGSNAAPCVDSAGKVAGRNLLSFRK